LGFSGLAYDIASLKILTIDSMKKIHLLPFYILLALAGINAFGQANTTAQTTKKGFAVLELFTSEGCSSCPSADALMGKIQQEYSEKNVYVLAYHVDYWDSQGWKDIFGNPDYTKRQYQYAQWMGIAPVYTPQVVVNGKSQYIGSQAEVVRPAIKKALSAGASAVVSLNAATTKYGITVNFNITGNVKNSQLVLAVVQKSAQSTVKRGENGGRTLSHYQIVRQLHHLNIPQGGKGSIKLQLPDNFDNRNFEVVGFVQEMSNGEIKGAGHTGFN
jgi:hypothetical protein